MRSATTSSDPTSSVDRIRFVIVTMDTHLASAAERARTALHRELPEVELTLHAASEWSGDADRLGRCIADIERADVVVGTMLFLEDQFLPILPVLRARRDQCDAMVGMISAGEVVRLTKLGQFDMGKPATGPLALLKRLFAKKDKAPKGGAAQMRMLRRLPKLLRYVPGSAQDVRAYFLTMQYWLGGSEENLVNLVRFLVDRYARGPRRALLRSVKVGEPIEYPEVGVYHPRMQGRLAETAAALPVVRRNADAKGRVGLLLLRSYLLAGNTKHYDGVIAAMEARGLEVVPVFAAGLDSRPAIERFFKRDGQPTVDAMVSLTGFSLVGGPAYNDAKAAASVLTEMDVPYVAAHPVEFQTLDQWGASERGLLPVESTIMVAIPELDGATGSMLFGGRPGTAGVTCSGCDHCCTFTSYCLSE